MRLFCALRVPARNAGFAGDGSNLTFCDSFEGGVLNIVEPAVPL